MKSRVFVPSPKHGQPTPKTIRRPRVRARGRLDALRDQEADLAPTTRPTPPSLRPSRGQPKCCSDCRSKSSASHAKSEILPTYRVVTPAVCALPVQWAHLGSNQAEAETTTPDEKRL